MMDTIIHLIYLFSKLLAIVVGVMLGFVLGYMLYVVSFRDFFVYRKAKRDIAEYVEGYKRLCRGNNRFVVTVETLQDSFREYDTPTIKKVWLDLINRRLIQQDPMDNEWCIR